VYEFQFGGEIRRRPAPEAPREEWTDYIYWRSNSPGLQTEWWNHRGGCRMWFVAERNTSTNEVLKSYFPAKRSDEVAKRNLAEARGE
jgi:sarcosine oxidase subunit delta